MRADVDPAILLGIAGDLQQQAPLVLVVVDANPTPGGIAGAEDAPESIDHANQIQRGIACAGRRLAEAESVNLLHAAESGESLACVRGMIQAVKRGQPEIALLAGRGVDAILPAAVIAAIPAALRQTVGPSQGL